MAGLAIPSMSWLISGVQPLEASEWWEQLHLGIFGSAHVAQPSQAKLWQHYFALYGRTLSPNMAGNSQKRWEFRAKWIILLVLGCSGYPRASNNWSTACQDFKKFSLAKLAAVQNEL